MTVVTSDKPCWIVVNPDSSNDDYETHYGTGEEAAKAAADPTYIDNPPAAVKRLDFCCTSATTACGYRYDEDGDGWQHWPDTAQEFQNWLVKHAGYRLGADGSLLCPFDADCDECNAAPMPVVAQQISGQLDLLTDKEVA